MSKTKEEITVELGMLVSSSKLIETFMTARMPARVGFKIRKAIKEIQVELETFEETRQSLLDQYGEKDKEGNPVIDKETNTYKLTDKEKFNEEFQNLVKTEVTLNITKLPVETLDQMEVPSQNFESLSKYETLKLTPMQLDVISYLFNIED